MRKRDDRLTMREKMELVAAFIVLLIIVAIAFAPIVFVIAYGKSEGAHLPWTTPTH